MLSLIRTLLAPTPCLLHLFELSWLDSADFPVSESPTQQRVTPRHYNFYRITILITLERHFQGLGFLNRL